LSRRKIIPSNGDWRTSRPLPLSVQGRRYAECGNKAAENTSTLLANRPTSQKEQPEVYCCFNTHVAQVNFFGYGHTIWFYEIFLNSAGVNGSCMHNAASSFQDGFLIQSASFNQHVGELREVLRRLRVANSIGNGNTCCFVVKTLKLLGYAIEDGLSLIRPTQKSN